MNIQEIKQALMGKAISHFDGWDGSYKHFVIAHVEHNLESVIPGANAISCGITDTGRSYLRFIRIIDNPHFHQEIPVTTFDKLPSAKRRVVGDYLNALKCSPNVKMDFYYYAMTI